jgi:hypothetical protein
MLIRFTRGKKGDVLTCVRADGTTTWMRERPGFVDHDLAHYAVETEFGYDTGFFGLVAHGWELSTADFGRDPRSKERYPWPGGEQQPVEYVVAMIHNGPGVGIRTPDEVRAAMRAYGAAVTPDFTDERIERARQTLARLLHRWESLPPGGSLELPFPAPASTGVADGEVTAGHGGGAAKPQMGAGLERRIAGEQ